MPLLVDALGVGMALIAAKPAFLAYRGEPLIFFKVFLELRTPNQV